MVVFDRNKSLREAKRRQRKRERGEDCPKLKRGTKKGYKQNPEHVTKLRFMRLGENNPKWKGGITSYGKKLRNNIELRLWREAVFARDNWTCQNCGKRGGILHAHHIKRFKDNPELRFAIDNGQTLCIGCHRLTDNYGGQG